MSGLDAPEIAAAYCAVRDNSDATNWLILSNPPPPAPESRTGTPATANTLVLTQTGTGGFAELRHALLSPGSDSTVAYGYVRIQYANDAESMRTKFALVVWIGERTNVMRKARVSIEAGQVAAVLNHASIQISASCADDLVESDVVARLRRAGGADYNGGRG